ncbi:MAG: hypothetical protein KJO88_10430, partial [Gammaproteobacteria bacterium]|nr:hypothetical protein [Gammaproteobacteria bacterium]
VILGITINTDNFTQYRDIDDSPLTATEFFGIVMLGDTVEAEGTQTSTSSMLAKELELDD